MRYVNLWLFLVGGMQIQRRNKLEIITCILTICRSKGSSKTKVVYQANLNFKNATLYLDWLIKRGYLEKDDKLYKTTPSGLELLANLTDIALMINTDLDRDLPR
jgi:predicted transcriptional regulator